MMVWRAINRIFRDILKMLALKLGCIVSQDLRV